MDLLDNICPSLTASAVLDAPAFTASAADAPDFTASTVKGAAVLTPLTVASKAPRVAPIIPSPTACLGSMVSPLSVAMVSPVCCITLCPPSVTASVRIPLILPTPNVPKTLAKPVKPAVVKLLHNRHW